MNSDRKLASVQIVKSIKPINGADKIESIGILGWECVASKGQFHVGEKAVYFEIDSFLPIRPEFEMLRVNSYKHSELMGEGFRLKTQTFKGKLSQGLVMPLNILPFGEYIEGQDVSDLLEVKEWAREEEMDTFGTIIADMPAFLKRTAEYRVQSFPDILKELYRKPYYISNKIDGTSTTFFVKDGNSGICGHDAMYKTDTYKYEAIASDILNKMQNNGSIKNVAIQGEVAGPGICKNRAGLSKVEFFAFNVMDIDSRKYLDYKEFQEFCNRLGIKTVEIVETGDSFNYTVEELLSMSDGVYKQTGRRREGIVVRPQNESRSQVISDRLSFKVLNNKYLLKDK